MIPLFIKAILEGERPTIFGDGSQTRSTTPHEPGADGGVLSTGVAFGSGAPRPAPRPRRVAAAVNPGPQAGTCNISGQPTPLGCH
ncbi:MAG: hypothetical protein MUF06_22340 [Pirellulaceae bacterium]|nr:hypothetical protein [Pirellulaceae bacterium]